MTSIPLRASIQSNAKKFTSLRRWSIRQLLDFNLDQDDDIVTRTGTGTATTTTSTTAASTNTNFLLHEVQIRLASQHSKLISFTTSIDKYTKTIKHEGGLDIVHKNLSNLQILHENTYSLIQDVTKGGGRVDSATITFNTLDTLQQHQQRYISNIFDEIMTRHGHSVETLADIVLHVRDSMLPKLPSILRQPFLRDVKLMHEHEKEEYLHSRLMIQLLCEHYVSLHNQKKKKKKSAGGAITVNGDIFDLIDDASTEARHVCDANLGVAPEVIMLQTETKMDERGTVEPPPIVRSWLHHALVEVIKNAMTSSVMHLGILRSESSMLPPNIHVSVRMEDMPSNKVSCGGGSDIVASSSIMNTSPQRYLVIKVIDQGIGVRDIDAAFGFARSSSRKRWDRLKEQQSYAAVRQPLGSLGVGLTMSRLMLRAFGGDLTLSNNRQHQHQHSNNEAGVMRGILGSGCTATLMINCDDSFMAKN